MQSDRELVQAAQTGSTTAFAELARRYGPRVHRLCRNLVRGHADADDLSQEVFLRAFQALPRFDGRSELFTWLYRIAVNLSLNRVRSMSIRRHVDVDDPSIDGSLFLKDGAPDQASVLERRRIAAALLDEIDALPPGLRTTLCLVCLDGVPQDQAAEILGCSTGTVAWRVHEARKRLRESLSARGLEDSIEALGGSRGGQSRKEGAR